MQCLKLVLSMTLLITVSRTVDGRKYFAGNPVNVKNDPPASASSAEMARYVVHNTEWASVGTLSVSPAIHGYPFVGLKSMADGPKDNGTGVPYMLMTDRDISMNDLNHDNRCTLFMTLAQGDYCKDKDYDPQDPRCARVMLTGSVEKLAKDSAEESFARNSLYSRHPSMKDWPVDHDFYFVKLNIIQVGLLDHFGGIQYVPPKDYFAASTDEKTADRMDRMARGVQVIQIIF